METARRRVSLLGSPRASPGGPPLLRPLLGSPLKRLLEKLLPSRVLRGSLLPWPPALQQLVCTRCRTPLCRLELQGAATVAAVGATAPSGLGLPPTLPQARTALHASRESDCSAAGSVLLMMPSRHDVRPVWPRWVRMVGLRPRAVQHLSACTQPQRCQLPSLALCCCQCWPRSARRGGGEQPSLPLPPLPL